MGKTFREKRRWDDETEYDYKPNKNALKKERRDRWIRHEMKMSDSLINTNSSDESGHDE